MENFDTFWELYPRKVAKAHARKMWARLSEGQRFAAIHAIPIHVRYWLAAGRDHERIPHPGSWISGERWEDELDMPRDQCDWWRSQKGIEAKAAELSVKIRTGESYEDLKTRILAAMR
jgi:hypothetical protein